MTSEESFREELERDIARRRAVTRKRETVRGAMSFMCWSAIVAALAIGISIHYVGWIPSNTYLLTGEYGLFSRGVSELYLFGGAVILVMQFLRFRATVHDDERSERLANYTGMAIGGALFIGFLLLMVGLFGLFGHSLLQGAGIAPSLLNSTVVGLLIVVAVFVVAFFSRKWSWRVTVEDDQPFGFLQRALGILIGLPIAALFGFSMAFLALISLERAGTNVEPLRTFFNAHTTWFVVLMTAGFLLLSGLVHACRRALRPKVSPVFLSTMLGTGAMIVAAKFVFLILVGLK